MIIPLLIQLYNNDYTIAHPHKIMIIPLLIQLYNNDYTIAHPVIK